MSTPNTRDEALPLDAVNLDNMPGPDKPFYDPKIDGTGWRLKFARAEDQKTVMAYHKEIAAGKITLLLDGESRADHEKKMAADATARDAFMKSVDKMFAEQQLETEKRETAKLAKLQAELNARYDRFRGQ